MEINNPKYKKIGIHAESCIFTIEKGIAKVLLVRRTNEPYKGKWALPGGAMYNNETIKEAALRELREKTGLSNINIDMFGIFDEVKRSKLQRMIAIGYIGLIDSKTVRIEKITQKTSNSNWFEINDIPSLAYDHNQIITESFTALKEKIVSSDILKSMYPDGFTMPEIQKVYESILEKTFDRRNFRKKLLSLDLVQDTGEYITFAGKKPAKLYKFKKVIGKKNVF